MGEKPHPEMGYRGCLGIIRLAAHYSVEQMEAAAERALLTGACREGYSAFYIRAAALSAISRWRGPTEASAICSGV